MNETTKRVIYVSAGALQRDDGCILLASRPAGKSMAGLWELPGGKIEAGETPEQALIRELEEELAVTLEAKNMSPLTFASHDYGDFHLFMPVFLIKTWTGTPRPQEGQNLAWVRSNELKSYPAPEADLPLFDFMETYFKHQTAGGAV